MDIYMEQQTLSDSSVSLNVEPTMGLANDSLSQLFRWPQEFNPLFCPNFCLGQHVVAEVGIGDRTYRRRLRRAGGTPTPWYRVYGEIVGVLPNFRYEKCRWSYLVSPWRIIDKQGAEIPTPRSYVAHCWERRVAPVSLLKIYTNDAIASAVDGLTLRIRLEFPGYSEYSVRRLAAAMIAGLCQSDFRSAVLEAAALVNGHA